MNKILFLAALIAVAACSSGSIEETEGDVTQASLTCNSSSRKVRVNPDVCCQGLTWNYYGWFCGSEDGIKSNEVWRTWGFENPVYDTGYDPAPGHGSGCVCLSLEGGDPTACWITQEANGPDVSRNQRHMRVARATALQHSKVWFHKNIYASSCPYTLRACTAAAGCPSVGIPW